MEFPLHRVLASDRNKPRQIRARNFKNGWFQLGSAQGRLTPEGEDFIRICRLDRPNLVAFRRLILDVLRLLGRKRDEEAAELRRGYLGYPGNLPDLSLLKPPGGNSRPEGIHRSAFARRERGELPEIY